jgi:putative hydrolase of the HAD superfamily
MKPIQNIIFDLGGVLLNLDLLKTRNTFIRLGVSNFDELLRIGHAGSFFKDYEAGTLTDDQFIDMARELTHKGTTREEVISAWNDMLLDFPAARIQWLKELKNKYRLFLFSNTNAIHLTAFQKKYLDSYGTPLDDLFEKAYYSHIIRCRKPDVTAFEYVIQDSGVDPSETLFIDDALVNVEGAKQAGLQAIHLEPGKTVLDLGI